MADGFSAEAVTRAVLLQFVVPFGADVAVSGMGACRKLRQ